MTLVSTLRLSRIHYFKKQDYNIDECTWNYRRFIMLHCAVSRFIIQ